jgi:hypothetical protein
MNRQRAHKRTRSAAVALTVGLLAILILSGCQAELPEDGPPPATSAGSAGRFVEKLSTAGQGAADTGRFTLTVTEEEVTSFLSIGAILRRQLGTFPVDDLGTLPIDDLGQIQGIPELEGVDLDSWQELLGQQGRLPALGDDRPRLRLTVGDPRVYFRSNGHIIVRGNAQFLILKVPARVVAAPRASQGELVLDFVEGQLGAVPMPEIIFDYLGTGLAQALLAGREYAEISEIRVTDGVATISGRWNR